MPFSTAFSQGLEIGRSSRKQKAITKAFEAMKSLDHVEEQATPSPNVQALPTEQAGEGMVAALNPQTALPTDTPAPTKVSLGHVDLDNFESIAMEAARASGDLSVYSALNSMMTQKLQTKLLNGLRGAQVALLNGDTATAEKALRKANYYVPNGQDISIRKDDQGRLIWNSPMSGKEEPITPESIGLIQAAASDPMRFTSMLAQMRKDAADDAYKTGMLGNDTERTKDQKDRTAEEIRSNKAKEDLQRTEAGIKRDIADSEVFKNLSMAEYYNRGGKGKGANGAAEIDATDRAKISDSIQGLIRESLQPTKTEVTKDQYTGEEKVIKKPQAAPKGFENVTEVQIKQIAADAAEIAIANPTMSFDRASELAKKRYLEAQKAAKK